jgi:23S rRNA (cytosine1962-C5)-methyltransferase
MTERVTVSSRGAGRLRGGHPWVYRSDVDTRGDIPPGIVRVEDHRGRALGLALWSPSSQIRLRLLTRQEATIDGSWWEGRVRHAAERRRTLALDTTAYRVVHAEADGLPSLVVDRYGDVVVVQLLSAGLEAARDDVLAAVETVLSPRGILLRNDASVRRHEGLPLETLRAAGEVPDTVQVREGPVTYEVALRSGQKTGAFLDQRDNRVLVGSLARGRALDVFTYHGLFALHMARGAQRVRAVDSSSPALSVAQRNAALNGCDTVEWIEANAFDALRDMEAAGEAFDTIVLDPPAFAKRRDALPRAFAGYKEINLRAMRLLTPGGHLLTCSCSFHVSRALFLDMLEAAAADSRRRIELVRLVGQSSDHPEILSIPETSYLKGALVRAAD